MNPDIAISICEEKLQFEKNTKRNFRLYVRKNNQKHLLTQLAYLYAESVLSNKYNNNNNNIGEIKQETPDIQVDQELQEKYDKLLKENAKLKETIKSHKTNEEKDLQIEKLQKSKDRIRKQYIQQINELERKINDYKVKYDREDMETKTDDISTLKKIINTLKIEIQDLKTELSIKNKSVFETDEEDDIIEMKKEIEQLRLDMRIAKRIPDFKNQLIKAKHRYNQEKELRKTLPLANHRVDPLDEKFENH